MSIDHKPVWLKRHEGDTALVHDNSLEIFPLKMLLFVAFNKVSVQELNSALAQEMKAMYYSKTLLFSHFI